MLLTDEINSRFCAVVPRSTGTSDLLVLSTIFPIAVTPKENHLVCSAFPRRCAVCLATSLGNLNRKKEFFSNQQSRAKLRPGPSL